MYCIKCGVNLAESEQKCPLCGTVVYHPELPVPEAEPLFPQNKMPNSGADRRAVCIFILMLFALPLVIGLFSDLQPDGQLDWFGYVGGALAVLYVTFALPLWFRRFDPAIFIPCTFLTATLYLMYINLKTDGHWFVSFALPVNAVLGIILSAAATLLHRLRRGKLFICGGTFIALGVLMLAVEYCMSITFRTSLIGWSVYPLIVLSLFGGFLIYLGASRTAREMLERKLFF